MVPRNTHRPTSWLSGRCSVNEGFADSNVSFPDLCHDTFGVKSNSNPKTLSRSIAKNLMLSDCGLYRRLSRKILEVLLEHGPEVLVSASGFCTFEELLVDSWETPRL
jgi:hypothetical protein